MRRVDVAFRKKMRYDTLDDYGMDQKALWFIIKDTGDFFINRMLLIHALIEQLLTSERGISAEQIDHYDMLHSYSEEPGDEVDAPYGPDHSIAVGVERILCAYLGVPWKDYEEKLRKALG